ncbi:hypothetical protein JHK82_054103 [Glycine max]|nr:hypothetical protein JHK82_054103 [Glycine max]
MAMSGPNSCSSPPNNFKLAELRVVLPELSHMKENERLRKKAQLLNQENQQLLSELKKKLSKGNAKTNAAPNTIHDLNLGSSTSQSPSGSSN